MKHYSFFNTPKINYDLFEVIDKGDWDPSVKTLKRLCPTRWVLRYDDVHTFIELFPYIATALNNIL